MWGCWIRRRGGTGGVVELFGRWLGTGLSWGRFCVGETTVATQLKRTTHQPWQVPELDFWRDPQSRLADRPFWCGDCLGSMWVYFESQPPTDFDQPINQNNRNPTGHSSTHASLMSALVGFEGLFFGRADYQDMAKRKDQQALEMIWRGSYSWGAASDIFTHNYYTGNYVSVKSAAVKFTADVLALDPPHP
jgi:hypothetical protein